MREDAAWVKIIIALAGLALVGLLVGLLALQSGLVSHVVEQAVHQPTWTALPAPAGLPGQYTPLAFPTFAAPGAFTLYPPTPTHAPAGAIYVQP